MKIIMLTFIKIFEPILEAIGNFIVGPFKVNPDIELVMIMIVFPIVLNAAQFWMVDNILKLPDKKTKEIIEVPEEIEMEDKPETDKLSNHYGDHKDNMELHLTCDNGPELETEQKDDKGKEEKI